MKKLTKKLLAVNTFGTLGYMLTLLSWLLFLGVIVLLWGQNAMIGVSPQPIEYNEGTGPAEPSSLLTGVGFSVTAIIIVISMIVVVVLPYFIGKIGSKGTRRLMKLLKITESKRHLFFTKCSLATLPLLGFFIIATVFSPADITIPAVHVATIVSSLLAMGCFLIQLVLSRRLHSSYDTLW